MKAKLITGLALLTCASLGVAHATSFNCAKANTPADRMICNDPQLSVMDDQLFALYEKVKSETPNKPELIANEKSAWINREENCSNKPCLVAWYESRMAYLSNLNATVDAKQTAADHVDQPSPSIRTVSPHKPIAPPPPDGHIAPAQSIAKAYTTTTDMRFRTIDYSDMVCTDPRYAVRANIITSGIPFNGPGDDSKWLQAQKDNKNCYQIAPDLAFHVTNAFAVYAGEMGAVWVVGVIAKGGNIAGYIPIQDIQFIPIPTL